MVSRHSNCGRVNFGPAPKVGCPLIGSVGHADDLGLHARRLVLGHCVCDAGDPRNLTLRFSPNSGRSGDAAIAVISSPGYFGSVVRTLLLLSISLALGACDDACSNEIITRLASPNGEREAVMFQRACGATTGYSTQISIVETGQAPAGEGNAFRADDDHGAAKIGDWGGSWAEMKWLASDRLLVRYAEKSRIFEQDDSIAGVSVSYESVAM